MARDEADLPLSHLYWHQPHRLPDMRSGDLHLWRIRTDSRGKALVNCQTMLGEHQEQRARRMRHAAHRERYIRAHAGLREILALYLDTRPESIDFEHGPAGKPFIRSASRPIAFNLTTTGDLALVGVCEGRGTDKDLGVDCEWIRPRLDIHAVARRMFDTEVAQDLLQTPEPHRLPRFYQAWTALEADAKADGRGLFRARAQDAVRPAVAHFIPEQGYVAAVARARLPPLSEWRAFDLL